VVPQIRVKAKRIGLRAMREGLNAKMGCHSAAQRRLNPVADRRPEPHMGCHSAAQRRASALAVGQRNP